jgi:hypothetical protein
MQKLQ